MFILLLCFLGNLPGSFQQKFEEGEWRYPKDCIGYGCDYMASWQFLEAEDSIKFTISTKNRNKWTGIGFSNNKFMPDTDAILGLVEESGRFFMMDTYLNGYDSPVLDQIQNIFNMSAWRQNGITSLQFYRRRNTGDKKDFQFTDNQCPYFIFPVQGGVFNAVNKRIRKHETTPQVSESRICVKSNKPPTTATTTTSTTTRRTTTSSTFRPKVPSTKPSRRIKIVRKKVILGSRPHIENLGPIKPDQIPPQILADVNAANNNNNNNINKLPVENVPSTSPLPDSSSSTTLNKSINEKPTTVSNKIDDHSTGANNDENEENSGVKEKKEDGKASGFAEWTGLTDEQLKWVAIIGGVGFLVLLVVIQALCMVWRDSRNKEKNVAKEKEAMNNGSQWKDYSGTTGTSAYSYENFAVTEDPDGLIKEFGKEGRKGSGKNGSLPEKIFNQQGLERNSFSNNSKSGFEYPVKEPLGRYPVGGHYPHYPQALQPDFYFMPHQRRYSGEVVKLFVDYNKQGAHPGPLAGGSPVKSPYK